ncbi:MAG: hypothetical protein ACR2GR_02265 [Rhodothermales bacterium]
MTTLRCLSSLFFLYACLAWTPTAHAQETSAPLYLRLDYMDVEPAGEGAYVELERQVWKPVHEALIEAGILTGWNLYAVRLPGGTENGYNYVTVNVYDSLTDLENPYPEDVLTRVHADTALAGLAARTYAARDLVRSELWVLLDQAVDTASADTSGAPSRYALIDFMRVKPGGEEAYISLERDGAKPVHQERVKEGKIDSWRLYGLMLPSGTEYGYNYGTAGFFDSLTALEDPDLEELISRVHEGADLSELMGRVFAARDLVRSELWELIDHAE